MKSSRVILDTNVLFAGLYSSTGASYQLLRLVDDGKLRPVLSVSLLFEYENILARNSAVLNLTQKQIEIVLDNLCALSDFQKIYYLWRPFLRDPKDDHVLELAVAASVQTIITHNLKDFAGVEKIFGIQIIPPGKYLEMIK